MIMRKGVIKEETLRLAFALVEWSLADIDEPIKMRKKEVRQWKRERVRERGCRGGRDRSRWVAIE
jgi:hypothetical protein